MDQYSVDMSRITVSQRTYDVRVNVGPLIESEMERLSSVLSDGGKKDKIIPLIPINDYYCCPVIHSNGQEMVIEYDTKKGLIIRSDGNVYGG